jgi:cytochrome c oxidase cbb3-type subunit 3
MDTATHNYVSFTLRALARFFMPSVCLNSTLISPQSPFMNNYKSSKHMSLMRCLLALFGFAASLFAAPLLAVDGAMLYEQNCSACHGERSGGIGLPLAAAQNLTPDDYIRKTIRNGRPGRIMPAFAAFSDDEVNAIVKHVQSLHSGTPPQYNDATIHGNRKHGKALFVRHCAACHGANGEGGEGTGVTLSRPRNLPIMAPALHNPGFLASANDQFIKTLLMRGIDGTPMPSFLKAGLHEKDINDIVAYIRHFEQEPISESAIVADMVDPVIFADSPYDLQTTIDNVKQAVGANNFVFIREQTLDDGLVATGQNDAHQHIIYFCNFSLLSEALRTDPRVGLFLPCRITVVEQNGKVRMMATNPKRLSRLFNNSELNRMCDEMTKMYRTIMDDATL